MSVHVSPGSLGKVRWGISPDTVAEAPADEFMSYVVTHACPLTVSLIDLPAVPVVGLVAERHLAPVVVVNRGRAVTWTAVSDLVWRAGAYKRVTNSHPLARMRRTIPQALRGHLAELGAAILSPTLWDPAVSSRVLHTYGLTTLAGKCLGHPPANPADPPRQDEFDYLQFAFSAWHDWATGATR